jgi:hypothetical protein
MFLKAISLTAYDSTSALKIGSIYTPPILSPPSKYKGIRTQARRFAILVSRLSVKYKVNRGQEFVIGGLTPGYPFDALIVGYYEGDRLLYAAQVRNGFVPLVRARWRTGSKDWKSTLARLLICLREGEPSGL